MPENTSTETLKMAPVIRSYDPARQVFTVVGGNPPYDVWRTFGIKDVIGRSQEELAKFFTALYTEMAAEYEQKVRRRFIHQGSR